MLSLSLFSLCPARKLKVAENENSLAREVIVGAAVFVQPAQIIPTQTVIPLLVSGWCLP